MIDGMLHFAVILLWTQGGQKYARPVRFMVKNDEIIVKNRVSAS